MGPRTAAAFSSDHLESSIAAFSHREAERCDATSSLRAASAEPPTPLYPRSLLATKPGSPAETPHGFQRWSASDKEKP
ncbi:hypothetical protein MRX96_003944 [Rhipicephalus microplus]